jgi:hypothetical protein
MRKHPACVVLSFTPKLRQRKKSTERLPVQGDAGPACLGPMGHFLVRIQTRSGSPLSGWQAKR